jgi:hypothetical protein
MKKDLIGFRKAVEKLGEDPPGWGPGNPFRLRPSDPESFHAEAQTEYSQQEKKDDQIFRGIVISQSFWFLYIAAVESHEQSHDPQGSNEVKEKRKWEGQKWRQGKIGLGDNDDHKRDHEPIKKEEVHDARVSIHQHPLVAHHVGPKGYEAFFGSIGAFFRLAQAPEPVPPVKTKGKYDRHDKEQEKIK